MNTPTERLRLTALVQNARTLLEATTIESDTAKELQKMSLGTVISYAQGTGFKRIQRYAIKLPKGWHELELAERNRAYFGTMGAEIDVVHAFNKGTAVDGAIAVPGVTLGDRIQHPVTMLGLPKGAVVTHASYVDAAGAPVPYRRDAKGWHDPVSNKSFDEMYFVGMIQVAPGLHWTA